MSQEEVFKSKYNSFIAHKKGGISQQKDGGGRMGIWRKMARNVKVPLKPDFLLTTGFCSVPKALNPWIFSVHLKC